MKLRNAFLLAAIALALPVIAFFVFSSHYSHHREETAGVILSLAFWQHMVMPGELSQAHASLENNCAACHTPVKGVEPASCIVCHANNVALLQRQPTAFHADIGACAACHLEHQGRVSRTTTMDHVALARVGLRQLNSNPDPETEDRLAAAHFLHWINQQDGKVTSGQRRTGLTPQEMILNCAACHGNEDRHFGLFGQDCAECHGSIAWTIPEFRHPPPTSLDCVQCHQAPPSHYMMHFKMISARVARQPHADVSQCFLCHQTTSWNDIQGVGWYKHH